MVHIHPDYSLKAWYECNSEGMKGHTRRYGVHVIRFCLFLDLMMDVVDTQESCGRNEMDKVVETYLEVLQQSSNTQQKHEYTIAC